MSTSRKLLAYIGIALLWSCAQPGRPSGGPKDSTPPEVILAVPPNYTVDWRASRIELVFDEYIQLKQPQQQIFISPPTNEPLDYQLRGKRLSIILPEDLLPNTTYVIQFGDALADLNEGNVQEEFSYVFSTGVTIDSLTLRGTVRDADQNQPPEGMKVHLYPMDSTFTDSVPALSLPRYIGVVDETGRFEVTNIRAGEYQVLGLVDGNSNYKYDLPTERIAMHPTVRINPMDTANISLYAFEPLPPLKLRSSRLTEPRKIQLAFSGPVDSVQWQQCPPYRSMLWNPSRDSAWVFLSDTLRDTTRALLTLYRDAQTISDTLQWSPRSIDEKPFAITSTNASRKQLPRDGWVQWTASTPIARADSAQLRTATDTSWIPLQFADNILMAPLAWTYEFSGELVVPAGSVEDVYGRALDTISLALQTKQEVDYATLILEFEGADSSAFYVIELVSGSGMVIDRADVRGSSEISWTDLPPQQLFIRALDDRNGNGKWDPGDYWRRTETEIYYYFDSSVDLKPNWEMEYRWSLKKE